MSTIKTIGEGQTYDLIAHGTFVILVGVPVGMLSYHFIAGLSVLIGILLFLVSSGIQIDKSQNRIRKYRSLLGFKFGVWRTLDDVKKIELRYFIEGLSGADSILAASNTSQVKVFDLYFLVGDLEELKYHSFTTLKPAFRFMKYVDENFKILTENQVVEFYQKSRKTNHKK